MDTLWTQEDDEYEEEDEELISARKRNNWTDFEKDWILQWAHRRIESRNGLYVAYVFLILVLYLYYFKESIVENSPH